MMNNAPIPSTEAAASIASSILLPLWLDRGGIKRAGEIKKAAAEKTAAWGNQSGDARTSQNLCGGG